MIKVHISGNHADVIEREPLTSGTVGKVLNFAFTEDWRSLIKYAVFEGSGRRIALTNIGESCIIPHEVLAKHGGALRVGVYGRTADGSAATPTVYAQLGIIQRGADPNADPSTKPTLPVWAQIQAQIGDLSNLTTEDKTNLVAAINEAAKSGGGGSGGKDGTGIESITYKGEDESGGNMYTVLLTDGTSYDITAPKGAKGEKGDAGGKGADGAAGADGVTPHIGDNGNWYLGMTDTGKPSRGETGLQGPAGPVGPQGPQGEKGDAGGKGADGAAGADGVTPHIGDNGNWYLGMTDTGKPSRGETGLQGPVGPAGPQGPQGEKGDAGGKGADGAAGADGVTPHIGDNGNWYLGMTDTGKPSRGETGLQGPVGPVGPQGPQGEKGDAGEKGDPGVPGKDGSDATVTAENIAGALGYTPAAPGDIPVVPAAEISANTAARHTHANKAIIDGITGQVTADKINTPDHTTDLVQYGAFQIAAGRIISQIPTVPAALPNPKALTIKIGSTTVTYDGSSAQTVEIADGSEVSY